MADKPALILAAAVTSVQAILVRRRDSQLDTKYCAIDVNRWARVGCQARTTMKVTLVSSSTGHQTSLHFALYHALDEYERVHEEVQKNPVLTEHTATPELTFLYYQWEQWRVTTLILAAACVEAAANLYIGFKAMPEQFAELEWEHFLDKWTKVPKLFGKGYSLPKDRQPYQDLKRLSQHRNALLHMKEHITRHGKTISRKRRVGDYTMKDEHEFVRRCRTLTDRLVQHLAKFDRTATMIDVRMVTAFASVYRDAMSKLADLTKGATP